MTDRQFFSCVQEAQAYTGRDAFVSDMAMSSIWGDAPDMAIPGERIAQLGDIYDAVHRSVKDIASAAGMSQRKMAERFCIPYRTMENWSSGSRECSLHIRLMMQECLGMIKR